MVMPVATPSSTTMTVRPDGLDFRPHVRIVAAALLDGGQFAAQPQTYELFAHAQFLDQRAR